MSVIWLSKAKWETVWNALHHIMIRQDFTVKTPSAGLSGSGPGAKLHIDLPAVSMGSGGAYTGFFKLVDASDATAKKITVTDGREHAAADSYAAGYASVSGYSYSVNPVTIAITAPVTYIFLTSSLSGTVPAAPVIAGYTAYDGSGGPNRTNACAVLLGRVYLADGVMTIHQDHCGAVETMIWGDCT